MTSTQFAYPINIEIDEDGRHVVSFPDLAGAHTDGADRAEALEEAADCLTSVLVHHMLDKRPIPPASRAARGQVVVCPDPVTALKAALHQALTAGGLRIADLARRLGISHRQASRLLDPRHGSTAERLTEALKALGKDVAISVRDAA